jgi:hypothetical protein
MVLSEEELQDFGTRGWVLKNIFSPDECAALRAAGEEQLAVEARAKVTTSERLLAETVYWSYHGIIDTQPSEEKPEGAATAARASVFKAIWLEHPELQRILVQLLGAGPPVFTDSSVRMAAPHPHRHTAEERPCAGEPSTASAISKDSAAASMRPRRLDEGSGDAPCPATTAHLQAASEHAQLDFTGGYRNNDHCQWDVQCDQAVALRFTAMDTEGNFDFVSLYDLDGCLLRICIRCMHSTAMDGTGTARGS